MKETIQFLKKLSRNNNREWFQANKHLYEKSHKQMLSFAEDLIGEMNKHDQIETSPGRSLFRIYRDVRFGKDKTPYKTNWAGRMQRATAQLRGGYYYQIGYESSFVMGGFFGPNAQDMLHIRKQIASDSVTLRSVINSKQFGKYFGTLRGEQLKTAPKGFERDHPDIDLLRYKQLLVRHDFSQAEVESKDFPRKMTIVFRQMRPFFDYMSEILTTDLNGESLL